MNRRPKFGRVFHRERDENPEAFSGGERVRIGVIGLSAGAGATLMTFVMARFIANLKQSVPAVVELSDADEAAAGWNYDAIGIDRRFAGREYFSFHGAVTRNRNIKGAANMDEGINWALRLPSESGDAPDAQQLTSLIHNVAGDVVLCDFSARLSLGADDASSRAAHTKRLLGEMTLIVPVVDPLPSKLLGGHARLAAVKEMEAAGYPVFYVINKFCRGVNRKELFDYVRPKEKTLVERMAADELYEAEYACKNPFMMQSVKRATAAAAEAVLRRARVIE